MFMAHFLSPVVGHSPFISYKIQAPENGALTCSQVNLSRDATAGFSAGVAGSVMVSSENDRLNSVLYLKQYGSKSQISYNIRLLHALFEIDGQCALVTSLLLRQRRLQTRFE